MQTVIRVENKTRNLHNIRRIFSKCGEIPALFLHHDSSSDSPIYFLKFSTADVARCAQELGSGVVGIDADTIHENPDFLKQYQIAHCEESRQHVNDFLLQDSILPVGMAKGNRKGGIVVRKNGLRFAVHPPSAKIPVLRTCQIPHDSNLLFSSANVYSRKKSSSSSDSVTDAQSPTTHVASYGSGSVLSLSPTVPTLRTLTYPASFETSICMNLCGEVITFNLQNLQDNPATVVDLLKLTKTEIHNWIVVAAHYRRTQRPDAASHVVNSLIKEFANVVRLGRDDIRPAFLLLSGCAIDQAQQAKVRGDKETASKYYLVAQHWLQKVFGEGDSGMPVQHFLKQKMEDSDKLMTVDTRPANRTDEVKSLRDELAKKNLLVSEAQTSKRKLEDENRQERELRRKLEHQVEDLKKQRDVSRKLEAHALDRVKREVRLRRQAEDAATVAREE